MKVFYIMQKRDSNGKKIDHKVYAITKEKSLAKMFLKQRNEDIFKIKEEEYGTSEAYHTLDKFADIVLMEETLHTSSQFGGSRNITLVIPHHEMMKVMQASDDLPFEVGKTTTLLSYFLTDKYLKKLHKLNYFDYMREAGMRGHEFPQEEILGGFFGNYIPPYSRGFIPDELSLFIHFFGWTMKKED